MLEATFSRKCTRFATFFCRRNAIRGSLSFDSLCLAASSCSHRDVGMNTKGIAPQVRHTASREVWRGDGLSSTFALRSAFCRSFATPALAFTIYSDAATSGVVSWVHPELVNERLCSDCEQPQKSSTSAHLTRQALSSNEGFQQSRLSGLLRILQGSCKPSKSALQAKKAKSLIKVCRPTCSSI